MSKFLGNFVQEDEAGSGGVVQNVRRLVHLDHEGRLTFGKVVARADPCKDPINHTDPRGGSREIAADLSQQGEQGNLPDVRRFTRHVWTGDYGKASPRAVERGIIGDKPFRRRLLIQHGMTSLRDLQHTGTINLRSAIAVLTRRFCQRGNGVQSSNRGRRGLNKTNFREGQTPQALENLDLAGFCALIRSQNSALYLFKLWSDEAFAVQRRLLANVVTGGGGEVLSGLSQ